MKKILVLIPSPIRGGAEEYALRLVGSVIDSGWEAHVGFLGCPELDSLRDDFQGIGAEFHSVDIMDVGKKRSEFSLVAHIFRTMALIGRVKPDVVMVELCGARYGLGALIGCALRGVPTCAVFQLVREETEFSFRGRFARAFARFRKQRYVAVSSRNRDILAGALGMEAYDIRLIRNSVSPERFTLSASERVEARAGILDELGLAQDAFLILTVGRLDKQKGHDLLIPSIAGIVEAHPNVRFVWVGDGPWGDHLRGMVDEHGVSEYVHFVGHRNDIESFFCVCDMFVLPTRFEGQPFSLIEAMAAGLPIVTTTASGIEEIVEHDREAILCGVEDVDGVRDGVMGLLDDPEKARGLGDSARRRMLGYTEQSMFDETIALFEDMAR